MRIRSLFAGVMLTVACAESAVPPAAPGVPIGPPQEPDSDLLALMSGDGRDPKAEAVSPEEKKKAEEAQKLLADFAKLDADQATERARMTEAVRKELATLSAKDFPTLRAALDAALKSQHRAPGSSDRDQQRHPAEMLDFFRVKTTSRVLELDAGAGWYTELLAPVLSKKGKLVVTGPDPKGPRTERATLYGQRLFGLLDKAPELGAKVGYVVAPSTGLSFAAEYENSFDVVLSFRNLHNWQRRGQLDKNLAEVFKALKPGGVFAVEAHRGKPDADPKQSAEKGYLPEAFVIERAVAAGFKKDASSEMNANPKDTKDYADGVWALPPTLRGGDKDKEKFLAIGESDRMTIRFVKPLKAKK